MEQSKSKKPSAQMEVLQIPTSMIRRSDTFLAQIGRTKKNLRCIVDEHLCEGCRILLREIFKSPRSAQRLRKTPRELHKQVTASCPMCMQLYARIRAGGDDRGILRALSSCESFIFNVFGLSPRGSSISVTVFDMVAAANEQDGMSIPCFPEELRKESIVAPSYLESSPCLNLVSKWLQDCVTNHINCRRVADYPPLRLIDVSPVSSPKSVSLRTTSDIMMQESDLRYVALSYCWGGPECNHLLTTKQTLPMREDSILLKDMPPTLRDAIIVTRSCGLRYLWIDALCICQDDQDEWSHEAARMGNIYGGALFVISASFASDSAQGLFHEKPRSSSSLGTICGESSIADKQYQLLLRRLPSGLHKSLSGEPLSSRAWAYQERLLAPAVLHFSSDQLIWECQSLVEANSGWGYTMEGRLGALVDSNWRVILSEYSGREITKVDDRLVALAGIAASMRHSSRYSGRYVAGMWEIDLSRQLLFGYLYSGNEQTVRKRPDIPTWSWAHRDGHGIGWPYGNCNSASFTVALLQSPVFHFATEEDDQRSLSAQHRVLSCEVRLTGYIQSFRDWKNRVRSNIIFLVESTSSMSLQRHHGRFQPGRYPFTSIRRWFSSRRTFVNGVLDDQNEREEQEKLWNGFYALRMATSEKEGQIRIHYLVLDEVENEANTSERIFRRVGSMYLEKPSFSRYADDPTKDIVDPQGYPFLTDAQVVDVTLI